MNRRAFITLLGGALVWPLIARAQEPGRIYHFGSMHSAPRDAPHQVAFFEELRRLGFVEGQNLTVDSGGYGLRVDEFDEHARALVKARVDVIVVGGDAAVRAAQHATSEIPILGLTDDMVGRGFVHSLAKPRGNTTGVTILAAELDGKRQEILIEAMPGISRVAALADSTITPPSHLEELARAARARGVALSLHQVSRPEEIAAAINAAKGSGAEALNVLASALLFNNRTNIFERIAALRFPAVYQWPEMADEGGFIGYGPRITQLYRDVMARQVVKLMRGAKPADIPVEQPTKFELVINLKTAKALGLDLPPTLTARADKVIE
jgi:putative tryptophan/tyrosine transport system substrate-binding protein